MATGSASPLVKGLEFGCLLYRFVCSSRLPAVLFGDASGDLPEGVVLAADARVPSGSARVCGRALSDSPLLLLGRPTPRTPRRTGRDQKGTVLQNGRLGTHTVWMGFGGSIS